MIQVYGVKFLDGIVKECAMRMGGEFYNSAVRTIFNLFEVQLL